MTVNFSEPVRRQSGWLAALRFLVRLNFQPTGRVDSGVRFLAATEGRSLHRSFARVKDDPDARRILAARRDWRPLLRDRAALAAAPPGSLGRHYGEYMTANGFDEDTYAIDTGRRANSPGEDFDWFWRRAEAMHDMRHVITGYGPDVLGEVCLIVFRYAQVRNHGLAVLGAMNALVLFFVTKRRPVVRALLEAYRRGRAARLPELLEWETGLAAPLAVHRQLLGLTPPRHYRPSLAEADYLPAD